MRNKLLSVVAGGLASIGGWALWSGTAAADQPRPVVPVQTAISVDTGSAPIQLVDRRYRRRHYYRDWDDGYYRGYYGGYYYSPRYRYYNYAYPRYYYSYPYGSYYTSYYRPYYYPSGGLYFTW